MINGSSSTDILNCSLVRDGSGSVSRSRCDNNCGRFIPVAVGLFFILFIHFGNEVPLSIAVLKSVKQEQKSLALGLKRILGGLIGSMPGPILFGYFIDKACLFWIQGKKMRFYSIF